MSQKGKKVQLERGPIRQITITTDRPKKQESPNPPEKLVTASAGLNDHPDGYQRDNATNPGDACLKSHGLE